mgnify:CR=1 FL=1
MALILGLESSCDDTAAALVTRDRQILAQAIVGDQLAQDAVQAPVVEADVRPLLGAIIAHAAQDGLDKRDQFARSMTPLKLL